VFPPPENLFVTETGYATWDPPAGCSPQTVQVDLNSKVKHQERFTKSSNRDLFGYNIYLDGIYVGFSTDLFWQYTGLVYGQTYIAGISATYEGGVSSIIEYEFTYNPFPLDPPQNLFVDELGYATWEAPNGGGTVDFTISLTDDAGDGWNGASIDLFVNSTLVLDDITLATGFGPEGFIFAVADGDFVEIYYTEGNLSYENAYYVANNFGYLVVYSGSGGVVPDAYVSFIAVVSDDSLVKSKKVKLNTKASHLERIYTDNTRDLLGYNVYLNGVFVDFTPDLFWQYTDLVAGTIYLAGVSALYDEGESLPVEYTFNYLFSPFLPPENVQVDEYIGLVTWDPPGGSVYGDDFESYNVGEYLAVQSDDWTTWSNNPGSGEDAFISDDFALSGTNSVKIDGASDVVLIMDNYISGCYSMDLNMYIVSGNTASFNLQKTNTPGEQWAMEIYFDVNGEARVDAGVYAACVFTFDFDTWLNFEIIVDLDNDLGELWFNGTQLHTWQWTLTSFGIGLLSLGGLNLWAWDNGEGPALAYYDDINFSIVNREPSDELTGYNVYLDGAFITYTIELQCALWNYVTLVGWEEYTAGVSAVYDDPGESIIVEVTFCYPGGISPPENLVATVFDYNDVHLEWEMERGTGCVLYTPTRKKRIENNRDSRMLLGYNVYRDGDMIAYLDDPDILTYDDLGLDGGTYEYWVTAIYDYGYSDPSNVEEVTIVLNPPQNLEAFIQGMNNVFLTWDAPAERDLDYYNVYRNGVVIDDVTSTFYLDEGVSGGPYVYNTTAVYFGGWESAFSNDAWITFDVGDTPISVVTELNGNYPNPFNPETTIKFTTENIEKNTELVIYNLKGQKVKILINEKLEAGNHQVVWNGKDENGKPVSSGIYFYKMKAGEYTSMKKMILMK